MNAEFRGEALEVLLVDNQCASTDLRARLVRSAEIRARGCPSGAEISAFIGSAENFDLIRDLHAEISHFLHFARSVKSSGG